MDNEPQHSTNHQPVVEGSQLNRQILSLAIPAFVALIAEPLLVTIDSAMVGHLGTPQLAGLALSSTILMTAVGVFIFLAYSTTALTSRALGAGRPAEGIKTGIDAMWLAGILGIITAGILVAYAPTILSWFNPDPVVIPHALAYLRWASPGIIGMLIVLAATGTLRGALDTKTPMYVATGGSALNAALNAIFIYGFNMGVAGSGLGTAIAQTLMAVVLGFVVLRAARRYQISVLPTFGALLQATATGFPLLVRTVTLRIALLATVAAVTRVGAVALAAHQVVNTVWNFASFALDALAIAAQALIGHSLGQGNPTHTHKLLKRIVLWGLGSGLVMGVMILAGAPVLPAIFGTDSTMRHIATMGLVVAGIFQILAGFVFMLDGVLIGAGDNRFLAWAGLITLIPYLPILWWITRCYASSEVAAQGWGLVWVWFAFAAVFMGMRAITTGLRSRGTAWMGLDNHPQATGKNAGESPRHR